MHNAYYKNHQTWKIYFLKNAYPTQYFYHDNHKQRNDNIPRI